MKVKPIVIDYGTVSCCLSRGKKKEKKTLGTSLSPESKTA